MWVRDREEGEVDFHSVSRLCSNSLKSAETFFHIKLDVYLEGWDSGLWGEDPGLGRCCALRVLLLSRPLPGPGGQDVEHRVSGIWEPWGSLRTGKLRPSEGSTMTLPLLGPSSSPLSGSPAWGALNLQVVLGGRGRRAEGSLRDRGLLALSVCEFHPGAESKGQQGVRVGLSVLWGWPPYTCDLCFEV